MNLAAKVAKLRDLLGRIERDFAPAVFANSFGAEDMVLTDLIAREFGGIKIFTLDTLRLPKETLSLMDAVKKKYGISVATYTPVPEAAEQFVKHYGQFSMYDSVENRKSCCAIRKVDPLNRALAQKKSWLTGLRREQAPSRQDLGESEFDAEHACTKFNPLIDWTEDDVWQYIHAEKVPYNTLHDHGFPSIGCEPCTRAVKPGEDPRAGRWWWEQQAGQQECGLHVKTVDISGLKHAAKIGVSA
jgi:phosphoadenosine phosphosulfate reductase